MSSSGADTGREPCYGCEHFAWEGTYRLAHLEIMARGRWPAEVLCTEHGRAYVTVAEQQGCPMYRAERPVDGAERLLRISRAGSYIPHARCMQEVQAWDSGL